MPRSTMTSGHLTNIYIGISWCRNASSKSQISATHTSSFWYKVIPIRIIFYVYFTTRYNDCVKSPPGTYKYPLTTFIDIWWISLSGYSLILNKHFTSTGFIPVDFTLFPFIITHTFLDRSLFTSEIVDILRKYPFGLVIASLRLSGSAASV